MLTGVSLQPPHPTVWRGPTQLGVAACGLAGGRWGPTAGGRQRGAGEAGAPGAAGAAVASHVRRHAR